MILIADKNLNKFAYPVFPIKGREITHPHTASYGTSHFICAEGHMKPRNWMIMDILGTYIYHGIYKPPNEPLNLSRKIMKMYDRPVINMSANGITEDIINQLIDSSSSSTDGIIDKEYYMSLFKKPCFYNFVPRPISEYIFNEGRMKKQFPFLKKYSSMQLCEMIHETANCKIGMKYPVRYFGGKGDYIKIEYANYNCPCSLFTLGKIDNVKTSSDGHVLERSYGISFNTYLGYFYLQNAVATLYTDLLPDKFYNMSDYAQLLYRLLILPYFKKAKNPIRLEEIRQRLGWKTTDISMVRKNIKRILDELEAESFIRNPKEITKDGAYMYGYEKTPWRDRK